MDSSQGLFQCLVNKSSFLALTVILTFLNQSLPKSLEKKNQDGFEDSYTLGQSSIQLNSVFVKLFKHQYTILK